MAWDSVPWFVGGGAQHSPEVARLLAYAAFGGKQGVIAPGDLKVQALSTPGASVRIAPGAGAILNRASGGSQQLYVGRNTADDTVPIAATGSGGGRSDLIIARIEDPFMAGEPWPDPADPTVGPYIFSRVISGVPNTTTSLFAYDPSISGIALARIDIPASTATITGSMIKDLRFLANPRSERTQVSKFQTTTQDITSSSFVTWPSVMTGTTVDVPSWATHAVVRATVSGSFAANANVWGQMRAYLGGLVTESTAYAQQLGQYFTTSFGGTLTIDSSLRGTTQTLRVEANKDGGTTGGAALRADNRTTVLIDIDWYEKAA